MKGLRSASRGDGLPTLILSGKDWRILRIYRCHSGIPHG